MNIFELVPEITHSSQDKIEITRLPEGSGCPALSSELLANATLEFSHYSDEAWRLGRDEQVDVTRHDHKCEQQKLARGMLPRQLCEDKVALYVGQHGHMASQVGGHEENPVVIGDPAQARHGSIVAQRAAGFAGPGEFGAELQAAIRNLKRNTS